MMISIDFKNKFKALHYSFTPNRRRELFSELTIVYRNSLQISNISHYLTTVHLTSVTDKNKTAYIISSGEYSLFSFSRAID